MYISWYAVMGGLGALLAIPATVFLFQYRPNIARIIIVVSLAVIMLVNLIYGGQGMLSAHE